MSARRQLNKWYRQASAVWNIITVPVFYQIPEALVKILFNPSVREFKFISLLYHVVFFNVL
jgi:hypothetical protein